jgi:hypothetical protein
LLRRFKLNDKATLTGFCLQLLMVHHPELADGFDVRAHDLTSWMKGWCGGARHCLSIMAARRRHDIGQVTDFSFRAEEPCPPPPYVDRRAHT